MVYAGEEYNSNYAGLCLKAMDDDLTAVVGAYVPQVSLYVL
jgi:hypothetical protein